MYGVIPVSRVHLMASLAGILLITLWERLHETRLVFCISMKIASGTCCSWQSDRSEKSKYFRFFVSRENLSNHSW